ncbi:MAG: hypothetical protein U9O94_09655 [Nanoarchaeota archaeon]|nr:hypothetical protein [Nanoarchaeota archaeon]
MTKSTIHLILLSLCLLSVLAADYDDWIYPGDTIELDEKIFNIEGPSTGEKIYIQYDNEKVIISEGDCEDTDFYRFCHIETAFDLDEHGKMDYVYDKEVHHIHMNITKTGPILTLIRSIDKDKLTIGEEGTITVKIKNTGIKTANSFTYEEKLPSSITIKSPDTFSVIGNTITWRGDILPSEEKELTYKIKPIKEINTKLKINSSYIFLDKLYYVESNELNIVGSEFKSSEDVDITIDKIKPRLGENTNFKVTITNKDNTNHLSIRKLEIKIPKEFDFIVMPQKLETIKSSIIRWNGVISRNSKEELPITIRGNVEGNFKILTIAEYEIDELGYKENINTSVSVTATKLTPQITFGHKKFKRILESGSRDYVSFSIKNNDKDIIYYNINTKIESDFFENDKITIDFIEPETVKNLKTIEYNVPFLTENKVYTINLTGTYKTKAGLIFNLSETETFNVKTANFSAALEVIRDIPKNLSKGEEGEVIVTLRNILAERIDNIVVEDYFGSLIKTSGVNKKRMVSLDPEKTIIAYTYKIKGNTSKIEEIETKITYDYKGNQYSIVRNSNITISEVAPEENITEQNQTTLEERLIKEEPIFQERKKSVFRRVIGGIGNFFKRIFKRN